MPLADAYAACARLAAAHYENFPVASRLVPSRMRPHVAAVYAFARTADDFADEDGYTLAERHALLDDWHRRLLRAAGSEIAGTEAPAPHQTAFTPQRLHRRPAVRQCGAGTAVPADSCRPRSHLPCPGAHHPVVLAGGGSLRGSPERLPPGHRREEIRHVGRRSRLLPPFGKPRGTARATDCRVSQHANSTDRRTRSARPSSSRTSGRILPSTGAGAACTSRWPNAMPPVPGMWTSTPRA